MEDNIKGGFKLNLYFILSAVLGIGAVAEFAAAAVCVVRGGRK